MSDYTVQDYVRILNNCKNKENFGGGCYEFCGFRENGCCELGKSEVTSAFLSYLIGEKVEFDSYKSRGLFTLKELVEKRENENVENNENGCHRCMIGDSGRVYLDKALRDGLGIKSGDFLRVETSDDGKSIVLTKVE